MGIGLLILILLGIYLQRIKSTITIGASDKSISMSSVSFNYENSTAAFLMQMHTGEFSVFKDSEILMIKNDETIWRKSVEVNYFESKGNLYLQSKVEDHTLNVQMWKLIYFEPFEADISHDWIGDAKLRPCGPLDDYSLHHNCISANESISKTIKDLPNHQELQIALNFHFLDEWEGEQAWIKIDGNVVWAKAHKWCNNIFSNVCMEHGIDSCGRSFPDTFGYLVQFSLLHNQNKVSIEIGSSLALNSCKANWAIDNLIISVR